MVVGQRAHAGAEPDVFGAAGGGGDEDLGGRDQLPAARVVLTDPRLLVPEPVEMLDQLEVALEREGRVLARSVEWCEEDAEPQWPLEIAVCHGPTLAGPWRCRQLVWSTMTTVFMILSASVCFLTSHNGNRKPM